MKVLHISTRDSLGGAARSAYRIHQALVAKGIDSTMRALHREQTDPRVKNVTRPRIWERMTAHLHRRCQAFARRNWHTDSPDVHSFGEISACSVGELNRSDADVLNLHWIVNMLSVADIGRLRKKPIVWTLHDMWPFCGGEHYAPDGANARFQVGYWDRNRPTGERGPDLNRRTWNAKQRAWADQRFTIVCPSRWLADCARRSILFANLPVHVVPNPLDTEFVWRPASKEAARVALALPLDRKLILMGAEGGVSDPRKGGDLLLEAIVRGVRDLGHTELLIYGHDGRGVNMNWPLPIHWLGAISDDRVLSLAYSAADVTVVPSRQEVFSNSALEAQACGTPVVAFDIGGLPDIVLHGETGWLAKPLDAEDLSQGIIWALSDSDRWRALSCTSRAKAVERFSPLVVAQKYAEVYRLALAPQNLR